MSRREIEALYWYASELLISKKLLPLNSCKYPTINRWCFLLRKLEIVKNSKKYKNLNLLGIKQILVF